MWLIHLGGFQFVGDGINFGAWLGTGKACVGHYTNGGEAAVLPFVGARGLEEGDGEYLGAVWSLAARQQGVFGLLAAWCPIAGGCRRGKGRAKRRAGQQTDHERKAARLAQLLAEVVSLRRWLTGAWWRRLPIATIVLRPDGGGLYLGGRSPPMPRAMRGALGTSLARTFYDTEPVEALRFDHGLFGLREAVGEALARHFEDDDEVCTEDRNSKQGTERQSMGQGAALLRSPHFGSAKAATTSLQACGDAGKDGPFRAWTDRCMVAPPPRCSTMHATSVDLGWWWTLPSRLVSPCPSGIARSALHQLGGTGAADPGDDAILPIADLRDAGDPDGGADPSAERPRRKRPVIDVEMVQQAQKLALMKEYMLASLLPGKFVSFKVLDQGDEVASCFAQIILVEPKVTCVELCTQEGSDLAFRVAVQEFTPVLPVAADHASLSHAKSIEVFCFSDEDPHDIDFGQLEPSSREDLLQWSARPSDCGISSHTTLHDPQALRPNASLSLLDRGMPTLCLLDWLSEAGWVGQSRLITHTPDLPKVFDDRTPLAHKDYLRCVIVIDDLYAAGIAELRSGRPTTYYRFILRFKKLPDAHASMAALQKLLADDDNEDPPEYAVPEFPDPVVPARLADEGIVMFSSGEDEPGPSSHLPPVPAPGTPIPIEAPEEGDAIIDDVVVDAGDAGGVMVPIPEGEWPDRLEGLPLRKIAGRVGDHAYFGRLGLGCPCEDHLGCKRTRSTQMLVAELGREAPLAFLGCWAENFDQPNHKQWTPTLAQMRDYKARRLDTGLATS